MSDGNDTTSDSNVSDKFIKNIDDIKKKIKEKYKGEDPVLDTDETRKLVKRKRGRKKKDVNDAVENLGTAEIKASALKFKKGVSSDTINRALKQDDAADKKKIRRRFGHSKLMKYVFHDAFGNRCGVFYSANSRKYLEKMLDVQINCIYEVSNADGIIWRVVGIVEDERVYLKYHIFDVGYVSCVGISNAIYLARLLCIKNNCKLYNIRFVNKESI